MRQKIGNKMKIPLAKPLFDKSEERVVIEALRSGWVTQGPKVAEFEKTVARYVGAKYAVAVSSATTALFLSLHIKGIGPGDEVIVPSLTFIATANVVMHAGAKPVFVDVNPVTLTIDVEKIEKAITKNTKAIIPVDQFGLSCDLDKINKIARKYKLTVIEDSAPAIGSIYKGRRIGGISEITCFSFHPRKLITTGDGGMITTNSQKIAERARLLRNQGMSISDVVRHKANRIIFEEYPEVGFNFRMTDLQAAVGIEQMRKLPRIIEKRELLAERYSKAFSRSDLIIPPFVANGYKSSWQTYAIRLKNNKLITRDKLMQKLLDVGIATRRGQMACHLEPAYKKVFGKISLPETEKATKETIALPLYPQMNLKEQNYVIDMVLKFINKK